MVAPELRLLARATCNAGHWARHDNGLLAKSLPTRRAPATSTLTCQFQHQIHNTTRVQSSGTPKPPIPQAGIQADSTSQSSSTDSTDSKPPRKKRSLRPYILATSFLLIGMLGGQFMRAVAFPPPPPEPESPEDEFLLAKIRKDLGTLPIVKSLRDKRDDWLEFEAYVMMSPETAESHMTAGTLQGTRGLGVQRVFYNKHEKRLISIVFFGGALSGWPGVTHGGMVSTLLQENLERVVNGPEYAQSSKDEFKLDNISVSYKKPTIANSLFIVRAEVDQTAANNQKSLHKVHLRGQLEDAHQGFVCATATAIGSPTDTSLAESAKEEATSIWDKVKQTTGGIFS